MKRNEEFKKMLFDDSYINQLNEFIKNNKSFNNTSFIPNKEINDFDKQMISYLDCLYFEIQLYFAKKHINNLNYLCLKAHDNYCVLNRYKDCFSCCIYNKPLYLDKYKRWYSTTKDLNYQEQLPYVEYENLKMEYNLEEIAKFNNIGITSLDTIINKIIDKSDVFYIEIYNSLTPEERQFIIKYLENKNCYNCTNESCKDKSDECCQFWENDLVVGKSKVLKLRDINKLN